MKMFKNLFRRFTTAGIKRYCACGHVVSANLPFCPHCGASLNSMSEHPYD